MSLLTTLLGAEGGGGGGGGGSVSGTILSPVIAATTTALTVTYANGASGIGATLTNAGAQAAFQIDGITLTVGQRALIKNQASALQNGVYSVTTVGSGATNWVLTRTSDFDEPSEMTAGVQVDVVSGTVNAATIWILSASVAAVGTNSVTFGGNGAGTVTSVSGAGLASGTVTTSGNITVSAAAQTDQQTATSSVLAVTPSNQQFHPSASKVWCMFDTTGTILASYGMTSVTDTGVGDWTPVFSISFSSTSYAANATVDINGQNVIARISAKATNTISIQSFNGATGLATDPSYVNFAAFGTRA